MLLKSSPSRWNQSESHAIAQSRREPSRSSRNAAVGSPRPERERRHLKRARRPDRAAVVHLPQRVPFGFQGNWLRNAD